MVVEAECYRDRYVDCSEASHIHKNNAKQQD